MNFSLTESTEIESEAPATIEEERSHSSRSTTQK